jgi:Uma2 family endonuclease
MTVATVESVEPVSIPVENELDLPMVDQDEEKVMGTTEVDIMSMLGILMGHFALSQQLGKVEIEMPFDLGGLQRQKYKPDIAFISFQRWPKGRKIPSQNAFRVVPDLVVEVVSPSNLANEVEEKVVEYLKAGVQLVWAVYPTTARIYVHDSLSSVRVLTRTGELDGGDVLPGFRLPLDQLFEEDDITA